MTTAPAKRAVGDAPKRRLSAPARRALIVEAALAEFAEHGYEGASMGRIGEAAGVSRTVLYDHFESKRALFVALLEKKQRELLDHLRDAIVAEAPMEDRMRAGFEAFLAFAEREPEAWRLLFPEHAPVDDEAAAVYRRLRGEANKLIAAMIAPDARRGGIDPKSPVGQAMFAMQQVALVGAVRWWFAHPKVSREELSDAAMAALWSGLRALE